MSMEGTPTGAWRLRAVGAFFAAGAGSVVATVLVAASHPSSPTALVARTVFSRACHQEPDRSFAWAGEPFCVCHRCFGIYAGLTLGASIAALFPRLPLDPGSRRLWAWALVPMLVHVALLNVWSPADLTFLRVGTGALFGVWGGFAASVALGTTLVMSDRPYSSPKGSLAGRSSSLKPEVTPAEG
jgi:uncharacterized membrane protein